MVVNPLQRRLDPAEVASAIVVEHSQGNEVHIRGNTLISRIVAANDSGDVRSVEPGGPVVVRVSVVFRKVPSTNHSIAASKPGTERQMIPCNPAVHHGDCLTGAGEAIHIVDIVNARYVMDVA